MPKRRDFLKTLSAVGLLLAGHAQARPVRDAWQQWKEIYLQDGRVIDRDQNGISHSEGQGYGLLLAQAYGDARAFREIESWTARNLAVRDDRLMAWKWEGAPDQNITDWHNATDGDLFRAWALLRAARDSGWQEFGDTAAAIARDLADLCLAADPRAPDELLVIPGAEARRDEARVLINPSYFMSRALRELGAAAGEPRLIRAADHGESVLAELAATGFLPNWIDVTRSGFAAPVEHDLLWGYDALRIPLYLVWSGKQAHPAVALAAAMLGRSDIADHLLVEAAADNTPKAFSNHPGYHAVRQLSACDAPFVIPRDALGGVYYPDTLQLMAVIAARESTCFGSIKP